MLNSRNQIIQDFDDMVNVLTMVAMVVSCTVQWDCDQWCRGGLVSIHRPLVARPPVPGPAPGPISGVATTSVVLATPSRADITHQVGQETIIYVPKSCKWLIILILSSSTISTSILSLVMCKKCKMCKRERFYDK